MVSRRQGRTETLATTVSLHGPHTFGGHTAVSHYDTGAPAPGEPAVRALRNGQGAAMSKANLLGPWVRRFLLEYLVSELNLARNTQRSFASLSRGHGRFRTTEYTEHTARPVTRTKADHNHESNE